MNCSRKVNLCQTCKADQHLLFSHLQTVGFLMRQPSFCNAPVICNHDPPVLGIAVKMTRGFDHNFATEVLGKYPGFAFSRDLLNQMTVPGTGGGG